jgi:hypothetical protein
VYICGLDWTPEVLSLRKLTIARFSCRLECSNIRRYIHMYTLSVTEGMYRDERTFGRMSPMLSFVLQLYSQAFLSLTGQACEAFALFSVSVGVFKKYFTNLYVTETFAVSKSIHCLTPSYCVVGPFRWQLLGKSRINTFHSHRQSLPVPFSFCFLMIVLRFNGHYFDTCGNNLE